MTNWLKRLFGGGSDEASTSEAEVPAAQPPVAPEPVVTPAEPAAPPEPPAEPAASEEPAPDTGDEPA